MFGFSFLCCPTIVKPWWFKLLIGKTPRLRQPTLSSFYRWR